MSKRTKTATLQIHRLKSGKVRLAVRNLNGRWSSLVLAQEVIQDFMRPAVNLPVGTCCAQVEVKADGSSRDMTVRLSSTVCRCRGRNVQVPVELDQ